MVKGELDQIDLSARCSLMVADHKVVCLTDMTDSTIYCVSIITTPFMNHYEHTLYYYYIQHLQFQISLSSIQRRYLVASRDASEHVNEKTIHLHNFVR